MEHENIKINELKEETDIEQKKDIIKADKLSEKIKS